MTSRSNCAKDNRTFRVKRPIEVVVLNCCVTENERGAPGIEDLDDLGKIGEQTGQPVDLVDDDIDPPRGDVGEQPLRSRPVHKEPIRAAAAVSVGEVGVSADAPSALNPAST